jgi:hypothetical protein
MKPIKTAKSTKSMKTANAKPVKTFITTLVALFGLFFLVPIYINGNAGNAFPTIFYTVLLLATFIAMMRLDKWF